MAHIAACYVSQQHSLLCNLASIHNIPEIIQDSTKHDNISSYCESLEFTQQGNTISLRQYSVFCGGLSSNRKLVVIYDGPSMSASHDLDTRCVHWMEYIISKFMDQDILQTVPMQYCFHELEEHFRQFAFGQDQLDMPSIRAALASFFNNKLARSMSDAAMQIALADFSIDEEVDYISLMNFLSHDNPRDSTDRTRDDEDGLEFADLPVACHSLWSAVRQCMQDKIEGDKTETRKLVGRQCLTLMDLLKEELDRFGDRADLDSLRQRCQGYNKRLKTEFGPQIDSLDHDDFKDKSNGHDPVYEEDNQDEVSKRRIREIHQRSQTCVVEDILDLNESELQNVINEKDLVIASLRVEIERLRHERAQSKTQIADLKAQFARLETMCQEIGIEHNSVLREARDLKRIAPLKVQIGGDVEVGSIQSQDDLQSMRQQLTEITKENSKLRREFITVKNQIKRSANGASGPRTPKLMVGHRSPGHRSPTASRNLRTEIHKVTHENDKLRAQITKAKMKLDRLHTDEDAEEDTIERPSSRAHHGLSPASLAKLREEQGTLKKELQKLRKELYQANVARSNGPRSQSFNEREMERENKKLRDEISAIKTKINRLNHGSKSTRSDERAQRSRRKLVAELKKLLVNLESGGTPRSRKSSPTRRGEKTRRRSPLPPTTPPSNGHGPTLRLTSDHSNTLSPREEKELIPEEVMLSNSSVSSVRSGRNGKENGIPKTPFNTPFLSPSTSQQDLLRPAIRVHSPTENGSSREGLRLLIHILSEIRGFSSFLSCVNGLNTNAHRLGGNLEREETKEVLRWLLDEISSSRQDSVDSAMARFVSNFESASLQLVERATATAEVSAFLDGIEDWNFDIFAFERIPVVHNRPIVILGHTLLTRLGFYDKFGLDMHKMLNWFSRIEGAYKRNPYHNNLHGADVMLVSSFWFSLQSFGELYDDFDRFILLLAGAAHDVGHTGTNNNFHRATGSELAYLYNDQSVLENHHASYAFQIMKKYPECDWLSCLDKEHQRRAREVMLKVILGTDMDLHGRHVGELKALVKAMEASSETTSSLTLLTPEQRMHLLSNAFHLGDIGNSCKRAEIAVQWAKCITEEFRQQGDMEKSQNMPSDDIFKRETPLEKVQSGWNKFVVLPYIQFFARLVPQAQFMVDCCQENIEFWTNYRERS